MSGINKIRINIIRILQIFIQTLQIIIITFIRGIRISQSIRIMPIRGIRMLFVDLDYIYGNNYQAEKNF